MLNRIIPDTDLSRATEKLELLAKSCIESKLYLKRFWNLFRNVVAVVFLLTGSALLRRNRPEIIKMSTFRIIRINNKTIITRPVITFILCAVVKNVRIIIIIIIIMFYGRGQRVRGTFRPFDFVVHSNSRVFVTEKKF